jgi:hypothetical protein
VPETESLIPKSTPNAASATPSGTPAPAQTPSSGVPDERWSTRTSLVSSACTPDAAA